MSAKRVTAGAAPATTAAAATVAPASTTTRSEETIGSGGMIANDLQFRVTRSAVRDFEQALARLDETEAHRSPEMRALMRDAIESQLEDLRQQLAEYEALRAGRVRVLELDSLEQLPAALIQARIAAGLTQKELASRLNMRESQLQRYEATRYAGTGLARLQSIADALGVKIHERVVLPTSASAPAAALASRPARTAVPTGGSGGAGRRAQARPAPRRRRAS